MNQKISAAIVATLICAALVGVGRLSAQGLPDEISQRMSSIPTLSSVGQSGASRPTAGSGFRPQGMSGRGLSRRDAFGEQFKASRGLTGMENQAALSATSVRAAAARQQLRLQQQRQQMSLRQVQSTQGFRDARHEMNHTLTLGFATAPIAAPLGDSLPHAVDIEARFRAIADRLPIDHLSILMNGRTAVLTGQAHDDAARRLAVRLVSLEPGVSTVDNRLTIPRGP